MQITILGLVWVVLLAGQAPSGLGEDPWKFDELLEKAVVARDQKRIESVVATDMRFITEPGARELGKQEFVNAERFSESLERNVDSVLVEFHGETVQTRGHIQVRTLRSAGPEYQIYYVRVYRRGPNGWQLASHETVRQVDGAVAPTPLVPPAGRAPGGYVINRPSLSDPWANAYRSGNDVTLPRVLQETKPHYTPEAMRAGVQGTVLLECVVNTDGTVSHVRVLRSLDSTLGLDDEAIKAAKQWRFAPGTRNGQPVPVIISMDLSFTLRK
jgi:TonB family protein